MQFKSLLLSKQQDWIFDKNYRVRLENFAEWRGISKEEYAKCLNSDGLVQILTDNTQIATKLDNFVGTPSVFINGKLLDEKYGTTTEIIIEALEKTLGNKS